MDIPITFTMDCENLNHLSGVGGVTDWAFSERSIRGFISTLNKHGHKATLFLCPETAEAHSTWLHEIEADGHELGFHFHPDSFRDGMARGLGQLGQYVGDEQRVMLTEGVDVWSQALGVAPQCFRPGCLSANDETYPILVDLGFTHGSVSSPGRNEPILCAIWQPPLLDVHWANAAQRSLPGNLSFVDVPLSVDWETRFPHRFGWDLPQELMIERGDVATLGGIVSKHVKRAAAPDTHVAICVATHNVWDYAAPQDKKSQILSGLIETLTETASRTDVSFSPASVGGIAEWFSNFGKS